MAGETYSFKGATAQWGTLSTSAAGTVVDETMKKTAQTDVVENSMGAKTGMVIYDTLFNGTLTIVAARPGVGKTAFAHGHRGQGHPQGQAHVHDNRRGRGEPVAVNSIELRYEQLGIGELADGGHS